MSNIVTSNAYNYSEFINSGVDNRTGSYSLSFVLGELLSNNLSGPNFKAVINYNALDSHQGVYGIGWSLAITSFNKNTGILTLQSGQQFKIEWNNNLNEYDIPYRRCKDIRVFYKSLSGQSTGEIVVAHKNGVKEHINWDDGTVSHILSPHGHRIDFHYSYYNNVKVLWKVSDTNHNSLYIDWWSTPRQTIISIFNRDDLKSRTTLWKSGQGLLQYISLPNEDDLYTSMDYRYVSTCTAQLITKVIHPTGLIEDIIYRDEGHSLQTGAPISKLPYVQQYIVTSGENQDSTITDYDYSDFNYLGFGSDASWEAGKDILFSARKDYKYSSTETVGSLSIVRIYNKYHLLEEEYCYNDGVLYQAQKNTYFANLSWSIDYQPANYSFVRKEELTFYVDGETRTESIERSIDEYGNETWLRNEDGSEIHRTFYPKGGETKNASGSVEGKINCPPHPFGMVRFMKSERLIPASKHYGEMDRVKTVTYKKIDSLIEGEYFVAPSEQTNHNNKIIFEYHQDKSKKYEYGRLKSRKTIVNNLESTSKNDYVFSEYNLEMENVLVTHDGHIAKKAEKFDYVTGNMAQTTDDKGIVINIEHNSFGMVTAETVAPGTDREKKKSFAYHYGSNENQVVITTNAGFSETYQFNNAGNLIRKKKKDKNNIERVIEERHYNNLGQMISATSRDWTDIKDTETGTISTKEVSKLESYEYDLWGEVSKLTRPDGVAEFVSKNPVALTVTSGVEGLSSQFSTYNLVGKELTTKLYDKNGVEKSKTSNSYDGYHRLRESTGANGQVTSYDYDNCDRMTEQYMMHKSEEYRMSMEYESFSTTDLASTIKLNGHTIGTRNYDGLGRVKNETKLGGTTSFSYMGSSSKASRITTPNGNILSVDYDPYIDEVVSITEAADATVSCSYINDSVTGFLREESTLHSKNVYSYNTVGQLSSETVTLGDNSRSASFDYSLLGNVLYETDFCGVEKVVGYDELGRVQTINFEDKGCNTSIIIHYDDFGREKGFTSTSGANTLKTEVYFNAIGSEAKREITINGTLNTKIESTYYSNGLIHKRRFTNSNLGITTETLTYDSLNRLESYNCIGVDLPKDSKGKFISSQSYTYDHFGNIETVSSVFADNSTDICTYTYDSTHVTQLKRVSHTHADYSDSTFSYDNAGNMLSDEKGRVYSYNSFNRLKSVHDENNDKLSDYIYDSRGFLAIQKPAGYADIEYYYRGEGVINQCSGGTETKNKKYNNKDVICTINDGNECRNLLLGADSQGSNIVSFSDDGSSTLTDNTRYTPFGNA
ncbi:hypothetical protein [Vibrio sp. TBV020]|uniref:RHS repeat domain-containing protein n=1 Tax=Vibrio sp. TBV020 TaxID=3137398 RepID=UPI0038CDBB24